jgi:hypothetical protein
MLPIDPSKLESAFAGKQWILLTAMLVGCVVAMAKQGWLSAWLAKKLPPQALPLLAMGLSVLSLTSAEIIAGINWQKALVDGVVAGFMAVYGHQTIVEGVRKGVEILPPKQGAANDNKVVVSEKNVRPSSGDLG